MFLFDRKGEIHLKIGNKLQARWTDDIADHTTKDKVYEVIDITTTGFWIINDKGEKCFPVSTSFKIIA